MDPSLLLLGSSFSYAPRRRSPSALAFSWLDSVLQPEVPITYGGGMWYTPPASPTPIRSQAVSTSAYDYYAAVVPIGVRDDNSSAPVPPLFPANNVHSHVGAYVPGMINNGGAARGQQQQQEDEDVSPNELWLRRHQSSSARVARASAAGANRGGAGGVVPNRQGSWDEWMPRPSNLVHIQSSDPAPSTNGAQHARRVSLSTLEAEAAAAPPTRTPGAGAFDDRRVRFAWGVEMSKYYEEGTTYENIGGAPASPLSPYEPRLGSGGDSGAGAGQWGRRRATEQDFGIARPGMVGGNPNGGHGLGGSRRPLKRAWTGRRAGEEMDDDGEDVDDDDETLQIGRPRRRGR